MRVNGCTVAWTSSISRRHGFATRTPTSGPSRYLNVPEGTELILGLIHHDDAEGDAARIAAARQYASAFSVATECGWGRGDPARVPGLLASHRRAIELLNQRD